MPLSSFLPPFAALSVFLSPSLCSFFPYVICILSFKKQEEASLWHRRQKTKRIRRRTRRRLRKRRQNHTARAAANTARFRNRVAAKEKSSPHKCSDPWDSNGHPRENGRKATTRIFSAVAFATSREPSFAIADHAKKASRSSKDREAFLCTESLCTACIANKTACFAPEGLAPCSSCSLCDGGFPRGCAGSLP